MNPYEADPTKIPTTDAYIHDPLFGRYLPREDDFQADPKHFNSYTPESLEYWGKQLPLCNSDTLLFDNPFGGRDVFALGTLIVKSGHRKKHLTRDFSYADANEVGAVDIARPILAELGIRVPRIYFAGTLSGDSVLIQERIPGVALAVAWAYLNLDQKLSFKQQARAMLRVLNHVKPPADITQRSYIVADPDPIPNRDIGNVERDFLFALNSDDQDFGFMHNDCQPSNIIVNDDKIVALIDWEMSGYFGWQTAESVHLHVRMPRRENFANAQISESQIDDIVFWNDLYSGNA